MEKYIPESAVQAFLFVTKGEPSEEFMDALNKATHEWQMRAARGEWGWICPSCCASFPEGMPDECALGSDECTDLIRRDKRNAHMHVGQPDAGEEEPRHD